MNKYSYKLLILSFFGVIMSLFFAHSAWAMTPTLTLSSNGYNTIQATVYGDANSTVILDYWSGQQLLGAGVIGYTNNSGYFYSSLNSNSYSIPSGAQVVVMVNGQQSNSALWQNNGYNNQYQNNNGVLSLSQTNVTLTVGQTQTIAISGNYNYNYNSNSYYIASNYNYNSGIVNASISGSTLTLYGKAPGSATINVCSNNYAYNTNCVNVYVTVTQSYYPYTNYYPNTNYPTYYTPTNTAATTTQVAVGGTTTLLLTSNTTNPYGYGMNNYYGNYNPYYVTNNNSSIASAIISGSTLTVYGISPGIATLSVCATSSTQCATVIVTVTGQNYYNTYSYSYPYNYNYMYSY